MVPLTQALITNKTVLVRVDYNVPLKDNIILDDTRLRVSLPTLRYILERKGRIILISHRGRPQGITPSLSLKPVAVALETLLKEPVFFCSEDRHKISAHDTKARVILLENIRFYGEEEKNDHAFAKNLASLGDLYVNDAFSVSHRAHASVEAITHYSPSYTGLNFQHEIQALNSFFKHPHPPIAAIIGGSKVSSKFDVLHYLMNHVHHMIIGGGMANTFLKAKGYDIGDSLVEVDLIPKAQRFMDDASKKGCTLHLPLDVRAAKSLNDSGTYVTIDNVLPETKIFDVGPQTVDHIHGILETCHTVVWNGPLGVFETSPYDIGSLEVARMIAGKTMYSLAGGGETVAVLQKAKVFDAFSHVSTAGGAFLEYMEGKNLPGLVALNRKN